MKKRTRVKIASYISAAVLIILCAGITGYNLANSYKTTIQYTYQRSLSQLSDYFSSIKSTLTKSVYANTPPQQYGLASKLMVDAEGAKNALSQLPISLPQGESLQKYLAQISDFSSYIIGILSRYGGLSTDNISSLTKLSEYADKIAPLIEDLSSIYSNGNIGLNSTLSTNLTTSEEENKTPFDNSYLTISESFVDYPSLIYDGPFADSVQQKIPKMTENIEDCTIQECLKNLSNMSGIPPEKLTYKEARKGNLPVYVFTSKNFYGTVTVKGGYICEMHYTTTETADNHKNFKQLLQIAKEFLQNNGFTNIKESYYITTNGQCTINFAHAENDITYYGDLIKVTLSTSIGKVIGYNAEGYIMNHTPREDLNPVLTKEEAENSVSKALKIKSSKIAMIPLSSGKEVLCYEFLCTGINSEEILVYINSTTGLEEQIYILLKNPNGSLVI